jgi:hypothetical protein
MIRVMASRNRVCCPLPGNTTYLGASLAGATQAPQPQPVELQDALHVCKQHLDLLALSARLLEGLGVGQCADAIAHLLVDVSRDLAHGPGRTLRLQPTNKDSRWCSFLVVVLLRLTLAGERLPSQRRSPILRRSGFRYSY